MYKHVDAHPVILKGIVPNLVVDSRTVLVKEIDPPTVANECVVPDQDTVGMLDTDRSLVSDEYRVLHTSAAFAVIESQRISEKV